MLVLGLKGSPRKGGNTDYLISLFMEEAEKMGARTEIVRVQDKNITPCRGCGYCEKKGRCIIQDDDMNKEIYSLLREADVIVASTPVFFFGITAQLKGLIDRCQAFWSRKYVFKLKDPYKKYRKGFLLSAGATKFKELFTGINLTAKFFFDAVSSGFDGSLTYKGIEKSGEMKKHPTVQTDIERSVKELLTPLVQRKKVLFACRENSCRSQMARAFARIHGGDKIDAMCAGSEPKEAVSPIMVESMESQGIDMGHLATRSITEVVESETPDIIVTMGCGENCPFIPGVRVLDWDIPDPAGGDLEFMGKVRDEIQRRVIELTKEL